MIYWTQFIREHHAAGEESGGWDIMSLGTNVNEKAALIWAIADKLTGVYKPHEYGEVILPLTVIRRFDCILSDTKDAVWPSTSPSKHFR